MPAFLRWMPATTLGLLLGLTACAASEAPRAPPAAAPEPKAGAATGFEISLRRGPCFGRCPQYSVQIDGAGRVRFEGERHVAAIGEVQGQADPAQLATLIAALRTPGLATLRDIYRPGQKGCGPMATDMPSHQIRWQLDDEVHQISYYQGCSGAPEALRRLPAAIDAVAGTQTWIKDGVDR